MNGIPCDFCGKPAQEGQHLFHRTVNADGDVVTFHLKCCPNDWLPPADPDAVNPSVQQEVETALLRSITALHHGYYGEALDARIAACKADRPLREDLARPTKRHDRFPTKIDCLPSRPTP